MRNCLDISSVVSKASEDTSSSNSCERWWNFSTWLRRQHRRGALNALRVLDPLHVETQLNKLHPEWSDWIKAALSSVSNWRANKGHGQTIPLLYLIPCSALTSLFQPQWPSLRSSCLMCSFHSGAFLCTWSSFFLEHSPLPKTCC